MSTEDKNKDVDTGKDVNDTQEKTGNVKEPLPQDISDEIDAGVEDVMKSIEEDRKSTEDKKVSDKKDDGAPKDKNPDDGSPSDEEVQDDDKVPGDDGEEEEGKDDGEEEEDDDDSEDAITDEHLERAVKAGLSISEAKEFGKASLLEKMISRLEEAGKQGDDGGEDGDDDGGEDSDDDPLAGIPDLDPEEYDETIVAGFKAMKDVIARQNKTIKELRNNASESAGDWFNAKVTGLGDKVNETIKATPEKKEQLKDKFEVLTAGYKAAGKEVDRDTVFNEAASMVLGEEIASAKTETTKGKLKKRGKQHIARPSINRGTPKGDVFDEIAGEVDRKFFNK